MDYSKPIKNSYWVIPEKFLAGEYPRDYDEESSIIKIKYLLQAGITCFIDLTHKNDSLEPYSDIVGKYSNNEAFVRHFPILDMSIPESRSITTEILDQIDSVIDKGGVVYIHCWGGVGRTGTVVGCWLARHGYKGSEALNQLEKLWQDCPKSANRKSPETEEQTSYIVNWHEDALIPMESRFTGCLLGLASGDALGTTVEFQPPGSFEPLTDIVGCGPFDLNPGEWTDDTSMSLCLAESLIECEMFDLRDQMDRYIRWRDEGHLSSNGKCFDIGGTVSEALSVYKESGNPISGPAHKHSAGNGCIMRLAPVPMFYASDPEDAIIKSAESSKTTHGTEMCLDACRYFGSLIVGALNGESKDNLLSPYYCPVDNYWDKYPLCIDVDKIARGSFKEKEPPKIKGTGFAVRSLEAALWAFHKSDNFRDGCLLAVNLGDDADTTGAVYGQLAGAYYGEEGIPFFWREILAHKELIKRYADELFQLSLR
ncbi:ADP-ribosylglycohydrolase family protein [Spirochaetota bacterium]